MSDTQEISKESIASNSVLDKVPGVFICQHVDEPTEKHDRSGKKYLATEALNPDMMDLIKKDVQYKVTAKVDGTCTLIKNGQLNKRRDIKPGKKIPPTWLQTGDNKSKHKIGFMPLEKGDKWHIDCMTQDENENYSADNVNVLTLNKDGTGLEYKSVEIKTLEGKSVEVMGPKFQKNPHQLKHHIVMEHGLIELKTFPKFCEDENKDDEYLNKVKEWFVTDERGVILEGIVVHFETGEMFKVHRHHLDLPWDPELIKTPLDQIRL